jgi:predicted GNAT superfamily acetyltransferase
MNDSDPAIIAKQGNEVVGYALVAGRKIANKHDLLKDLFKQIDQHSYNDISLQTQNYIVVGQLCVDKKHRDQGVVPKMYNYFKSELSSKYAYCITDVDTQNPRSVKAHLNAGFEIIGSLNFKGKTWHIVLWDWNRISNK